MYGHAKGGGRCEIKTEELVEGRHHLDCSQVSFDESRHYCCRAGTESPGFEYPSEMLLDTTEEERVLSLPPRQRELSNA